MTTVIQARRGTAAQWASVNPIPASGEPCFETDTSKFKFGDGVTRYALLAYQGGTPYTGSRIALAVTSLTDVASIPANTLVAGDVLDCLFSCKIVSGTSTPVAYKVNATVLGTANFTGSATFSTRTTFYFDGANLILIEKISDSVGTTVNVAVTTAVDKTAIITLGIPVVTALTPYNSVRIYRP